MRKIQHIIDTETKGYFNGKYSLHFFIRSLFCIADKNDNNEYSKYNVYTYKTKDREVIEFFKPNGNVQAAAKFIKHFRHNYKDFKRFAHILSYAIFFYEIDNKIITNLYKYDENNNLVLDISENIYKYLLKDQYSNSEYVFKAVINAFINNRKIINYKDCPISYRRIIEKDLIKNTQSYDETILTVSHSDDHIYHIHRLIKLIHLKIY